MVSRMDIMGDPYMMGVCVMIATKMSLGVEFILLKYGVKEFNPIQSMGIKSL